MSLSSRQLIALEHQHSAHNYHPLPVVCARGSGVHVWDPEGRRYLDFLSAYSAVNQGHGHPRVLKALTDQAARLSLSSRAFHNDVFPLYAKFVTEFFGYDKVLPMNTGAEAVETAMKVARKWAYEKKGIAPGRALIISCSENFHGRTIGVISMSTDPTARDGFGPYLPNVGPVCPKTGRVMEYDNMEALEAVFEANGPDMAGFLVEPIQGEAGVRVPADAFLARAHALCRQHNVLFIADEVQTGIARTGRLLAMDHIPNARPDIVILGKALGAGVYPVSAVLADNSIMEVIRPGEHGSTFGGNPLACAVAIAALEVVRDEKLAERAETLGKRFRAALEQLVASPLVRQVRGRGLLNAIEMNHVDGKTAWQLCLLLKRRGMLAKPTHDTIIRLAPPLSITEEELDEAAELIKESIAELEAMSAADIQQLLESE